MTQGNTERLSSTRTRSNGAAGHTIRALASVTLLLTTACYAGIDGDDAIAGDWDDVDPEELDVEPIGPTSTAVCGATMSVFPVAAPHNIGYDAASCGGPSGCEVSCPDANANSDWNPAATHNGIDIFAHEGADLVAVADGEVTGVGEVSDTSGIRVKIRDACGWSYYYGHLRSATVVKGQHVSAGDHIGYMGHTGTGSTHLHFNVSPGDYTDDINPIDLLVDTSPTACGGAPTPEPTPAPNDAPPPPADEPPAQPPEGSCGVLVAGDALGIEEPLRSCDERFAVLLQSDGNIALYQAGSNAALWNATTTGQGGEVLVMQEDGNLVLYSGGSALWHTGTHGHPGSYLHLQSDGALIVFEGATPIWWSGTGGL